MARAILLILVLGVWCGIGFGATVTGPNELVVSSTLTDESIEADLEGAKVVVTSGKLTISQTGTGQIVVQNGGSLTLITTPGTSSAVATADLDVNRAEAIVVGTGAELRVRDLTVNSVFDGALFDDSSSGQITANQFYLKEGAKFTGSTSTTNAPTIHVANTGIIDGTYTVGSEKAIFERGLQINSTGVLQIENDDNEIFLGNATTSPTVTVNGGKIITGDGTLTLNNQAGASGVGTLAFRNGADVSGTIRADNFRTEVTGNLNLTGGSRIFSDVYQQTGGTVTGVSGWIETTKNLTSRISGSETVFNANAKFAGDVEFTNGATLKGGARTIEGNATRSNTMTVDDTSLIDLSTSDLNINNFKRLNLNGTLLIGRTENLQDANKLTISNDTQVAGSLSRILELDSSFNEHYYGSDFTGNEVIVKGGDAQSWQKEDWSLTNAFGTYNFAYNDMNNSFDMVKFETSDLDDIDEVRDNLNSNWSGNVFSRGFASNIAEVAKASINLPGGAYVTTGSTAGQINFDILEAFAHGNSTFGTDSNTGVSGTLDRALLSMYNGSNQTGVVQVSVDVSKDIVTTLHSRLDAFRRYLVAIDPATGSEVALGNAILEDGRYFNRVWAGVLGSRMNADKRKGFEGYKYKGEGGIIGYDRGFGAAMIGFSAAYIDGDYEDKSSIAHDSDIENYAFDVYGTYNFSNGFYTSLNAGYTRSRNKINELRGDNWAREKYHTDSWRAGFKIGYDVMVSDTFFVSPSIGVDAYYSRSNRHDAAIDGQNLVEYGRMKTHGVEIPVDVKLSKDIVLNNCSTVTLMANGGYAYNLHDKGIRGDLRVNGLQGVNVGAYRAEGRKLGHHSWNAGAGVRFRYNEWEFAAKYDFNGRKGYTNHRVMGQVGFNF